MCVRTVSWCFSLTLMLACGSKTSLEGASTDDDAPPERRDGSTPIPVLDGALADGSEPGGPDAGRPLGPPCSPIPPQPLPVTTRNAGQPSLAFDGRTFGLIWADVAAPGGCGLGSWFFARFDRLGNRVSEVIALGFHGDREATGTLLVHDGAFWAVMSGDTGVTIHRLGEDRSLENTTLLTEPVGPQAAIWTESGDLALVHRDRFGEAVRLRVFDAELSERWASPSLSRGGTPALVASADRILVTVSVDFEDWLWSLTEGAPVGEPQPLAVPDLGGGYIGGPAVLAPLTSGAAAFFVASGDRPRTVEMARIGGDGRVRDIRPITSAGVTLFPAAATDSATGEVGLIWKHGDLDDGRFDVRFARFDGAGEPIAPEEVVFPGHEGIGCGRLDAMTLAATGDGYGYAVMNRATDGSTIMFGQLCR